MEVGMGKGSINGRCSVAMLITRACIYIIIYITYSWTYWNIQLDAFDSGQCLNKIMQKMKPMLACSINSSPQRDRNTCSAQRLKPGGKLCFYCSRGCYKLKKHCKRIRWSWKQNDIISWRVVMKPLSWTFLYQSSLQCQTWLGNSLK